jgi:16S rRNA (guanine527-N7)-methyltransferase
LRVRGPIRQPAVVDLLTDVLSRARDLGFLGPGPVEAHVSHAQGFAAAFDVEPGRVADLGSGGGVPGLVLAELWPKATIVLIDASERRTAFLAEAVDVLALGERVQVVRGRAEEVGRDPAHRGVYEGVVARGFGPPPVTAECAAPLLQAGGLLVVSEPPNDAARWDDGGLAYLGMHLGPLLVAGARYQVVRQETLCPARFPRRVGIPAKRPLW